MKRIISLALAAIMLLGMLPPMTLAASGAENSGSDVSPAIVIDNVYAKPGDSVKVYVDLENNPGITAAAITVSFDEALTLTAASNGAVFADFSFTPPKKLQDNLPVTSKCQFAWVTDGIEEDEIMDGTILILTFQVAEDAEVGKTYGVTVYSESGDIVDRNSNDDYTLNGTAQVAVIDYTPGDVNDDGRVAMMDVVYLCQYIVDGCQYDPEGYARQIVENAANVNGDTRITMMDVVRICQYIVDGCQYDPEGYAVKLLPVLPGCSHTMEHTAYKAKTCEEDGNIEYYHCTTCDKYYNDSEGTRELTQGQTVLVATGHTVVTDPYVAPTYDSVGWTEGSHCSTCGETIKAQEEIPPLEKDQYLIKYQLPSTDTYLDTLDIVNSNPTAYTSEDGVDELVDLDVAGYDFYGWYTEPNGGGTRMSKIAAGTNGTITLYAYMKPHKYTITYNLYRTPVERIDEDFKSYTVDQGKVNLPNPDIYNYIFLGWYTDDGTEVTQIPVGTTGDITLNAYWTSKRNLAKTAGSLEDPIIIEDTDNGVIYFTYELGTIENVPLTDAIWTIQSVSGLAQQKSETISVAISETQASEIAQTISNTTVDSATWTLAEDWNEVTSVSEEWAEQNGMTVEEANTQTKTESGTYSVTDSKGGSKTTTDTDGTTTVEYKSQNYTHGNSAEFDAKISGSYSNEKAITKKLTGSWEVGLEISGGYEQHKETNEHTGTDTTTVDTTVQSDTSTWNKSSTSSSTKTASESVAVTEALSSIISNSKGYGSSYATGGESSESQGFSTTDSQSVNTSSTLTYCTSETITTTTTYSTDGKSEGCYRLVIAGTVHVFAVVGYDVATQSYFTYTFNIMDDKTYEFLDYSPDLSFSDYENSALPFEIPYFVHEYVTSEIVCTDGLTFKTNSVNGTAMVIGYSGSDTDVVIPAYISSGNTAYKVIGISSSAFAGTFVEAIVLSKFIKEIPAGAFKNCTALKQVSGYFTVIGDEAFSGCTSLENFTISSKTTSVGADAFKNVPGVTVKVLNGEDALAQAKVNLPNATEAEQSAYAQQITQEIVDAVLEAGAHSIVLDISDTIDGVAFAIEVGEITSFELLGGKRTYQDMQINSAAASTILRELTIKSSNNVPLNISSNNLTLEVVNVESQAYSLLLSGDAPCITLIRDNCLTAVSGDAVVCKAPEIVSETVNKAIGTIMISGNVYVNGTTDEIAGLKESAYLDVENGEIILISDELYSQYIKGAFYVTFNADGGTVEENSRLVFCGSAVGALPDPVRTGYNFVGWYTEDGTLVTESTAFTSANDIVLVAKWSAMSCVVTFDANGGEVDTAVREVYYGLTFGELPVPSRDYHNFLGWYTEDDTQITEDTVIDAAVDFTVYAKWELKAASGWVKASEVPEDAQVVDQKWSYTLTTNKESTDTSMSGYSQVGSYWVKSGSGSANYATFPSGFDTGHSLYTSMKKSAYTASETTTTKREVSNSWAGYVYWHWMYNVNYANTMVRTISAKKGTYNSWAYIYFFAMTSTTDCAKGSSGYVYGSEGNGGDTTTYNCSSIMPSGSSSTDGRGTPRMFRFSYYCSTYTDYYKMFQYRKVEDLESTTEVTASDTISNVQEWVQYREK